MDLKPYSVACLSPEPAASRDGDGALPLSFAPWPAGQPPVSLSRAGSQGDPIEIRSSSQYSDLPVVVKRSAQPAAKKRERLAVQPGRIEVALGSPSKRPKAPDDSNVARRQPVELLAPHDRLGRAVSATQPLQAIPKLPGKLAEPDDFIAPASPPWGSPISRGKVRPLKTSLALPDSPVGLRYVTDGLPRFSPATPPSSRWVSSKAMAERQRHVTPSAAPRALDPFPPSPSFVPRSPEWPPSSPASDVVPVTSDGLTVSPRADDDKLRSGSNSSLSAEQRKVLDLVVKDGVSLFFTGSAGTGKSFLLRQIIESLREKYDFGDSVAVTASTGIAAYNIGGTTLHSFASVGQGNKPVSELLQEVLTSHKKMQRYRGAQVLVIDEVSMVDAMLFDKISTIASIVRDDPRPFGGIQLVVTGDFMQLPPVIQGDEQPPYAFQAEAWLKGIKHMLSLTKVFRQAEPAFVELLNEVRLGTVSVKTTRKLQSLADPVVYADNIKPTELFPLIASVDASNSRQMAALKTETVRFSAQDSGNLQSDARARMIKRFPAQRVLELKIGAQVMLVKNDHDRDLFNGSVGIVKDFSDQYPRVVFGHASGCLREFVIEPVSFSVENAKGETLACRYQVPLILAWAVTIHKSQGMTLERVKVDLSRAFARGQAYVALSRATSLKALQVIGFTPDKVLTHDRVMAWTAANVKPV